jgi:hypothetical protein
MFKLCCMKRAVGGMALIALAVAAIAAFIL